MITPTRVAARPAAQGMLTEVAVREWRSEGVTLVSDLLPSERIESLIQSAKSVFPEAGTEAARSVRDFGSGGRFSFPSTDAVFNALTLDPALVGAVAQLLNVEPTALRLTQSDLWPKYGHASRNRRDNQDQRIHMDYPNHMLVHPPPWANPAAVEIIIYYSDARECAGETGFVTRAGESDPAYLYPYTQSPGMSHHPFLNDRSSAEEYFEQEAPEIAAFRASLYEREKVADFRVGDVLFYRHDVWHRGRPLVEDTMRLVQNLTFRCEDADWVSQLHVGWPWAMYREGQPFERWVANASVFERTLLGFPPPGHAFWTRETLAGVIARYGPFGFDVSPYRDVNSVRLGVS